MRRLMRGDEEREIRFGIALREEPDPLRERDVRREPLRVRRERGELAHLELLPWERAEPFAVVAPRRVERLAHLLYVVRVTIVVEQRSAGAALHLPFASNDVERHYRVIALPHDRASSTGR